MPILTRMLAQSGFFPESTTVKSRLERIKDSDKTGRAHADEIESMMDGNADQAALLSCTMGRCFLPARNETCSAMRGSLELGSVDLADWGGDFV